MRHSFSPLVIAASLFTVLATGCASTHSSLPNAVASAPELLARPDVSTSPDIVVERSIEIASSPAEVFAILVDAARWTEWDPNVKTVKVYAGRPLAVGDQFYQDPAGYACEARVLDVVSDRVIRWRGEAPGGGGIVGVHSYRLVPSANGGTVVIDREEFSKWYLRLVGWATDFGIGDQFDATLRALKRRAETV